MHSIVVAEDNEEDFETFERIFNLTIGVPLIRCRDGEDLLTYLTKSRNGLVGWPSLILLDLNMPGTDGREALTRLKSDPALRSIPTIIFSTSSSPRDVNYCYNHGANGYMTKPVNYMDLERMLHSLVTYWDTVMLLPSPPHQAKKLMEKATTQ